MVEDVRIAGLEAVSLVESFRGFFCVVARELNDAQPHPGTVVFGKGGGLFLDGR